MRHREFWSAGSSLLILLSCILLAAPATAQHHHAGGAHADEALGTVSFPSSCDAGAHQALERGVALLHHMMYEEARASFEAASRADSSCALASWGIAMTLFQPMWPGQPTPDALQRGWALMEEARHFAGTERERAYLEPMIAFYRDPQGRDYRARISAWEEAQAEVHRSFPDDDEAAAFFALAHLATASPSDKAFEHQRRASVLLAEIIERNPTHPGALHYSIHAHDYVGLADQAVGVARSYDPIAPTVPHALHMPSHIFVRQGLWRDVIDWNRRSADAALDFPVNGQTSHHYSHALDYLMYARLQRGEDERAEAVLEELMADEAPQRSFVSAYGYAATPARFLLERHRWSEAARLEPRQPPDIPWDASPGAEAITFFARGIGAARGGDPEAAREALARLEALKASAAGQGDGYWAEQIEIQRLAVAAWAAEAAGEREEAVLLMRRSAELEASTEKHPVTPGHVLPAHELLGDLLLGHGDAAGALEAYRSALDGAPLRFNSLYGAAVAAARAGDRAAAGEYRESLAELTRDADLSEERVRRLQVLAGG